MNRQAVRAILKDGANLVLIKRIRSERPVYWVAPGGGVEAGESLEEALHRELLEELGATVTINKLGFSLTTAQSIQSFYWCTLTSVDPARRNGREWTDQTRGQYRVEAVSFTSDSLASINLLPPELKTYLIRQIASEP